MGRFVVYYVYTKGKKGNPMQTDRQTPARGIVVALYHGKVVPRQRGGVAGPRARGPTCGRGKLRAGESWREARKFGRARKNF